METFTFASFELFRVTFASIIFIIVVDEFLVLIFNKLIEGKKLKMIVDNLYTSVAVNQVPSALDWGLNGKIVYAARNAIALVKFKIF